MSANLGECGRVSLKHRRAPSTEMRVRERLRRTMFLSPSRVFLLLAMPMQCAFVAAREEVEFFNRHAVEIEALGKAFAGIIDKAVPIPIGNLTRESREKLLDLRASILTWAPTHKSPRVIAQPDCDTPNRFSCDATFWNGIACSNANENDTAFTCRDIPDSQTSNGMLWRSPWEARAGNTSNPDEFSRDQGLGVLCSLLHTQNTSWYQPWYDFISANKGSMCPGKFYDCWFVTPFWCTFNKVVKARGLEAPSEEWMVPRLGKGSCNNEHLFIYISCKYNDNGSGLHLAALDVYIRRMLNDWDQVMQNAADILHKRDPLNAFFWWLSRGSSDELANLILNQVPKNGDHRMQQWAFVRADKEKAWTESMGWEFVFLIDHLLKAPVV